MMRQTAIGLFATLWILLVVLPPGVGAQLNFYPRAATTGGGSTALDALDGNGYDDGDGDYADAGEYPALANGDGAFVILGSFDYCVYTLDADASCVESAESPCPQYVKPDSNPGTKCWVLLDLNGWEVNPLSGTLTHERGGLEADISAYSGIPGISGGATSEVDTEAELEAMLAAINLIVSTEVDAFAEIQALVSDKTLMNDEDDIGVSVQAYDADLTTYAGITPAANTQSFLAAANYAAMRTLLDLEAGTDFYSMSAADLAFEPLDLAITKSDEAETITANWVNTANPWADNEVADNVTASNYLPLAGGTMTGALNLNYQGLEDTYQQVVVVAKAGGDYTTIQGAIDSIVDAAADKRYAVLIYPGDYTENVVMGNYIDLVGHGRTNTRIYSSGTSGTVLTYPATKGTASDLGIVADYGAMTAESTAVLSGGADSIMLRCDIDVSKSDGDFKLHSISVTGGAFRMIDSHHTYTITMDDAEDTGLSQSAIIQNGALTTFLVYNSEITATCADTNDDLIGFETVAGGAGTYTLKDNIINIDSSGSSATGLWLYGTATGATVSKSHMTVNGSSSYGYWIDSTAGGAVVNSRHNDLIVTGAGVKNSFVVAAGDTINSYFDAINAVSGYAGAGTINIASTEAAGTLTASGIITSDAGFTIGSAAIAESELEMLDGITPGTAAASKALVLDGSQDIATINSLSATTLIGALTGNASSATALAANGANCAAGNYPLGVDANGAVESCTPAAGGGTMTTIKENDAGVGDADIVTLDFLGADFDLAETPDTEIQVVIAAALMRDAEINSAANLETVANLGAFFSEYADDADAATMRTTLGLVIGTNVQAYDADLTTYAGITPSANVQSFMGAADYAAMQALLSVDDLITLSGVSEGATHLGAFSGSTITDNQTVKAALQLLETAVESASGYTNLTSFVDQTAWRVFYSNADGDVTELALGADGTYLKSNGASSAPTFETPAGSGDVTGPGSATDNAIARFDGTGGKTLQNSGVTIDDSDNVEGATSYASAKSSGVAGTNLLYEANSTDTNGTGWKGPASVSGDLYFQFSNSDPAANSIMLFGAPSTGTSAITWVVLDDTAGNGDTSSLYSADKIFDELALQVLITSIDSAAELESVGNLGAFFSDYADDADASTMRTTLGLAIGSDVQAYHASLASIAGQTETNGGILYGTADNTYAWLAAGATTEILVGGGAGAPVWTTATGTGAPVRQTSPTLTTPIIGAATGTSLSLSGTITGTTNSLNLTTAEGAHDGAGDAATLSDSGESWPTDEYIGMTLYNITDGSSCTVTDNNGTTMTCTLSGGTDDDWDVSDVWAVAPGPNQSGSVIYIGAATTILHPATAGYAAIYYSTTAATIKVDPQSGSMQFTLDGTPTGTNGEELDSEAGAGDFICIHNQSTTVGYTLGRSGAWTDGGAS